MLKDHDDSNAPTEAVLWPRPEPAALRVIQAHPALEAEVVGPGMLMFLGYLVEEAPFSVSLSVQVDEVLVVVAFDQTMVKEEMLDVFRARLPHGYQASTTPDSQSELLIIEVFRPVALPTPQLVFACTDTRQKLRFAGRNRFIISGTVARGGSTCVLELRMGEHQIRIRLRPGDPPLKTAHRLRGALPPALGAIIALPLEEGAEVEVSLFSR